MGNQIQNPNIWHEYDKADPMHVIKTHPEVMKIDKSQSETGMPREKSESHDTSQSTPRSTSQSDSRSRAQSDLNMPKQELKNPLKDMPPQNVNL